jgi:hypothetical protein
LRGCGYHPFRIVYTAGLTEIDLAHYFLCLL